MGSGSGSQSSSNQSTRVPAFQKKYLQDLFSRAQTDVANNPMEMYGGPMVAAQDPATLGYYGNALDYAQNGNAGLNEAAGYNSDVLSGKYLSPESNPNLRATYDQAAQAVTDDYRNSVLPAISSRFARSGNSLSGQYLGASARADQGLARGLSTLATGIYGGAYDAERGRMDSARSFSPVLAEDQQNRLAAEQSVGQQKQSYAQSLIDELINRFDFAQNEPAQRLSRYSSLLGNPITIGSGSSGSRETKISFLGG
jgi:hypothetical protein